MGGMHSSKWRSVFGRVLAIVCHSEHFKEDCQVKGVFMVEQGKRRLWDGFGPCVLVVFLYHLSGGKSKQY